MQEPSANLQPSATRTSHRHTFLTLDALRGIAAIIVVLLHCHDDLGRALFFHGYFAVDFFFALSAFVLSYAYQQKLDHNLGTLQFLKIRLIRLYPLYIATTVLGFLLDVARYLHTGNRNVSGYLLQLLLALFFIPMPPSLAFSGTAVFPYNSFAWTLFYELFANIIHALFLRKRSTRTLIVLCAIAGAVYFHTIVHMGSGQYGTLTKELPVGIQRVLFSYVVGILLFRLWSQRNNVTRRVPMAIPALLLIAVLAVPRLPADLNACFEICMLLIALPAIVYLGAISTPPTALRPLAATLGLLSYGIYLLQGGLHVYLDSAWRLLFHRDAADAAPISGVVYLLLLPLLAWLAHRYYDVPVRRWLRRKLHA